MTKTTGKSPRKAAIERVGTDKAPQSDFEEVLSLIDSVRTRALAAVNTVLVDLYWQIGKQISRRIADNGWDGGRSRTWPGTSGNASRMQKAFPRKTSGECGSSTRPIGISQNSQRC